ncbi:hypothetical protein TSUD_156560, partial [Trifolium subterraneum]
MCALRVLTRLSNITSKPYQHHTTRTLIFDSSQFVNLHNLTHSDSGIVEVRLDRPEAKNAIGKEMLHGLSRVFQLINQNSDVNVAMIRSSVPGVFCAGADLKAIRVPTIAVIEGVALGGGLEMALACDIRICGSNALMGLPETGLAIIPGAGGTQRLPRLVGKAIAKDIIFTGRKINGIEALSLGLVNYCVDAGEAHSKALEIARDINQKGPVAIRMAKRAINEGMETDLTSALALEEDCYDQVLNTKDRLEGLAAFAEKRKPRYTEPGGKLNENLSLIFAPFKYCQNLKAEKYR